MPITSKQLAHYVRRVFIETGTHTGLGVQEALAAGFQRVWSIEFSQRLYEECREKFSDRAEVTLFLGDSRVMLPVILEVIDEPVTFWLDAHAEGCGDCVVKELEAIYATGRKDNIILIDDADCFDTPEVRALLMKINPDYQLNLIDGQHAYDKSLPLIPNGILAATQKGIQ